MAQQIPRRAHHIETVRKAGSGSYAEGRDDTGDLCDSRAVMLEGRQELRNDRLAFAFHNAVNCARAMLKKLLSDKRCAVATDKDKTLGKRLFGEFREINDLRDI